MSEQDATPRKSRRKKRSRGRDPMHAEKIAEKINKKRRRIWPLFIFGIVLLLVYLLPNLASIGVIRRSVVASLSDGYPVKVEVDGASIGWFSPVVLYGVHVTDLNGEPLLDADKIICRSSLSSLVYNSQAPGVVRVENPNVQLHLRGDSSNWEELIAAMPPPESDEPAEFDAALEVAGGTIEIHDTSTGTIRKITNIDGKVDYPILGSKPLGIALAATVGETADAGQLQVDGQWMIPAPVAEAPANWGNGEITIAANRAGLEIITPLLRRAGVAQAAAGTLDANIVARRPAEGGPLAVAINNLSTSQLRLMHVAGLSEPQVAIASAALAGEVSYNGDQLGWQAVKLMSNLGEATASGGIHLTALAAGNLEGAMAGFEQRIAGELNVAALARALPATVTVRDDVQLRNGLAKFNFTGGATAGATPEETVQAWTGLFEVVGIEVVTADNQVRRIPPARINLAARGTPAGIVIDQLTGEGEFFALQGSGSLSQGTLTANLSLDQLQQELGQAIDLRGLQLAGIADLRADWSRGEQNAWNASASARMTNWALSLPDRGVWREQDLTLSARAGGIMHEGSLTQLNQGDVILRAGVDEFSSSLTAPVDLSVESPIVPASFALIGNANRWQTRLAAVMPLEQTRIDGHLNASGELAVSSQQLAWRNVSLRAEPLQIATPSMLIDETRTILETSAGTYSFADGSMAIEQLSLAATSVSGTVASVAANLSGERPTATGQVDFRGDWSKISRWFASPQVNQGTPWMLEGTFSGKAGLVAENNVIAGNLSITSKDTTYYQYKTPIAGVQTAAAGPRWETIWREPEATVAGKLSYQTGTGNLQLENLSVLSNMLRFAMTGTVTGIGRQPIADLKGNADYDLAKIMAFLADDLSTDVQLVGRKQSEFFIRGPLTSSLRPISNDPSAGQTQTEPLLSLELGAGGGFAWERANLYGLPVGAGAVNARLEKSVLYLDPIDVPVSDGRLLLNSKIYMYEPAPLLEVSKGRIVDNVQITPQMCRAWLKYVAPLTADVTRVEGRLSLDLNDSLIPLDEPRLANTSGKLTVSNAQLGPGPLSEALIFLARRIRSLAAGRPVEGLTTQNTVWMSLPQQQIPFAAKDGRVYHENMQTSVGDVIIVTNGSVGMADQSLQMVAEIPIRKEWFPNQQGVLATLAGRKLQIPVGGTVTQPDIDSSAVEALAKQGLQGAANDLLNEGIRRGLDRLFGPPPQQ